MRGPVYFTPFLTEKRDIHFEGGTPRTDAIPTRFGWLTPRRDNETWADGVGTEEKRTDKS